ncbi:LicD family protein [Actinomyces bowdenii]|uniref:LicD family protein n=1 Tax=Actinomyces bowdenii TaxID=131109 RepID=A0A853EJZ1_9ACTO|nr:LicD family protein [Actinomyces bowdenii]MBF0696687.1 LicD family protein [Actinomyces bowdenii]NYS68860.1 LicD family protein [Actinomyces bowdenii]
MTQPGYSDPEILRKVQRATTMVLAELHRVCAELGIQYAVYGGTAIGAVRHQGFIPWDDDADVCMAREDYERFLAQAPAHLRPGFRLLDPRTVPDYPQTFAVLGLEGTEFVSQAARRRPFVMPLGVDVFPLDTAPRDAAAFRRQCRGTWLWGRLLFLRGTPSPAVSLPTPARQAARAVMHTVHWGLRALHVTPAALQRRWERTARRFEGQDSPVLADHSTRDPAHWAVERDELFPAVIVPFEDIEVNLPRAYDAVLRRGYGDYMELPPPEQRVNHQPFRIAFGPFEAGDGPR